MFETWEEPKSPRTLQEAVDFTEQTRESWREGKGRQTALINARHVLRILGPNTLVESLGTRHFTILSNRLKAEGKANATVNRVSAALSAVLTELRRNGHEAPRIDYKREKETKGRPTYYSEAEVNLLISEAAKEDDYLLLHDSLLFSYKTGCRRGELIDLKISDIDWANNEVCFRDVKTEGDHYLPIHADLKPVLERRINYAIGEYVFAWSYDNAVSEAFFRLRDKLGLSHHKKWHTVRHTTATHLAAKGVPLRTIMGVLNHQSIETTLRYAKAADTAVKDAIDLL